MAIEDAPAPRCPACGGDLPVAPYEKTVTCTYCSAQHANTACLALESEVLVASPFGYELRRVTRCEGPTAIGLAGRDGLLHVDDLIPVVRVTGPLAEHVEVFRRGNAAWVRTWTASSLRDGRVKVKHEGAAFQSSFFDQHASLDDLRLDARPSKQQRRSWLQALGANLREAPIATLVTVISNGIRAALLLVLVAIAVAVAFVAYKALRT
jgi:hypothetical protein